VVEKYLGQQWWNGGTQVTDMKLEKMISMVFLILDGSNHPMVMLSDVVAFY
jgi:hypothetical protein